MQDLIKVGVVPQGETAQQLLPDKKPLLLFRAGE